MWARVSTIQGKPEEINTTIEYINNISDKGLEKMKSSYFLVDRKSGKGMTITLWDSLEDLQESSKVADQIRNDISDIALAEQPRVEIFEVASQD